MKQETIHIAIFASGAGSNAQKIIDYFKDSKRIKISLIVCNNPDAGILKIAEKESVPVLLIEKHLFRDTGYVEELKNNNIQFIVLAGFLWKIPPVLIEAFKNKIVNIHPALLPAYGGKGMYGTKVHQAVIESIDIESGATVHLVDPIYDHGRILSQARVPRLPTDDAQSLAARVLVEEHKLYSAVLQKIKEGKIIL